MPKYLLGENARLLPETEAKALGFSPTSIAELMREIVKDVRRKEAEARLRPEALWRVPWLLKKIAKAASRGETSTTIRFLGFPVYPTKAEAEELQFHGFRAYSGDPQVRWD